MEIIKHLTRLAIGAAIVIGGTVLIGLLMYFLPAIVAIGFVLLSLVMFLLMFYLLGLIVLDEIEEHRAKKGATKWR
jgi:hypothetical protein